MKFGNTVACPCQDLPLFLPLFRLNSINIVCGGRKSWLEFKLNLNWQPWLLFELCSSRDLRLRRDRVKSRTTQPVRSIEILISGLARILYERKRGSLHRGSKGSPSYDSFVIKKVSINDRNSLISWRSVEVTHIREKDEAGRGRTSLPFTSYATFPPPFSYISFPIVTTASS